MTESKKWSEEFENKLVLPGGYVDHESTEAIKSFIHSLINEIIEEIPDHEPIYSINNPTLMIGHKPNANIKLKQKLKDKYL